MPRTGYRGVSFPFRISPQGGVVMSSTSFTNPTHIVESIRQILGTHYLQRVMEADIYSELIDVVFEPNDETLQAIAKSRIIEALERLEERVETSEDDIQFSVEENERGCFLYAVINFRVVSYNTWYTQKFEVGELDNE